MFLGLCVLIFAAPAFVLSHGIFDDTDAVFKLDDASFDKEVTSDKGVWVVMFYLDTCIHCKNFAPEFAKAAESLSGLVKLGVVDCRKATSLPQRFSITGFPSVKVFGKDKRNPTDYSGARTASSIVESVSQLIAKAARKESQSTSDVIELTDDNFDEILKSSDKPFLVKFFAPWCGHCKQMEGAYKEAATATKGKVSLGEVDATVHNRLANRFGIRGYPTLKYFAAGDVASPIDYGGDRSKDGIVSWLESQAGFSAVKAEVKQITSQSSFEECLSKTICIVAFLPMDEDTTQAERVGHIDVLQKVMEKTLTQDWGWYWNVGNSNEKLETVLAIDGLSYPFCVAIFNSKRAFTVSRSAFDVNPLANFVSDIRYGKITYSSLPSKLPQFKDVEPFGQPEQEL